MSENTSVKRTQLINYKRFLLNRVTSTAHLVDFIEDCLAREDEAINTSFHKIMVHNWAGDDNQLYDTMSEYYSAPFIPVDVVQKGDIFSFYTSNLYLVLKIIKFEFMFPFTRNMFNIDILFNDKSSVDLFEKAVSIEDIVVGVVIQRFKENFELDLSNFCKDQEFLNKRIVFYKLILLANFKSLMQRMGKDTKALNLSHNDLNQPPAEILNFFIRGDLTSVNLSYNNIQTLNELQRVSSKIEKLWIEGNPLCETLNPVVYVKSVNLKFPRLTELDGVSINQYGMTMPFFRNFLCRPDKKTKMIVEKFITLYFSHFDGPPKLRGKRLEKFYDENAILTIQTDFKDRQYAQTTLLSRNMLDAQGRQHAALNHKFLKKPSIGLLFQEFMETVHDLATFSIDVLLHTKKALVLVVDGVFKHRMLSDVMENKFQFRRTFIFTIYTMQDLSVYHIANEMFTISPASEELASASFKNPIRNINGLALIDPEPEDTEAIVKIFQHYTQLKKTEAELRLKYHSWDVDVAIRDFLNDMRANKIPNDRFIEEDDFSDSSSLLDEID